MICLWFTLPHDTYIFFSHHFSSHVMTILPPTASGVLSFRGGPHDPCDWWTLTAGLCAPWAVVFFGAMVVQRFFFWVQLKSEIVSLGVGPFKQTLKSPQESTTFSAPRLAAKIDAIEALHEKLPQSQIRTSAIAATAQDHWDRYGGSQLSQLSIREVSKLRNSWGDINMNLDEGGDSNDTLLVTLYG